VSSVDPSTLVTASGGLDVPAGLLALPREPDELGRIGPYGILRPLGSGGMGMVFLARQPQPRRLVALKMLREASHDSQRRARFASEAEISGRLQHPNIVQVYEFGDHWGWPYFTMEYVDGGSLAQRLAVASLAPCVAAELVRTLARAVQFAHEQGFVHRDLKPANILLKDEGGRRKDESDRIDSSFLLPPSSFVPKIADFGLARAFPNRRKASETLGRWPMSTPSVRSCTNA
jgi:serine/threonine-protein kinase